MQCPSCRDEAPDGSRFCPACGQGLQLRAEERRVVTVVFADIVGFTGLSEGFDPEHLKHLVDRAFQRLVADITNHGGRVDKIVGDQIMALFGAPIAHEDDAERAVRAALKMLRTLNRYAEEAGLPLRMRVGVNTGEALVGSLRAGGEYTAMGDAVNVASRLQTSADPGQVVVGARTFEETQHSVAYTPIGAVSVRGREEPVDAYVATQTLVPPGHRPRSHRSPLKGRAEELQILCTGVDMALRRQRPQLVVLLGEAGIGKSRLADELTSKASDDHGALVLRGRCVPYGEANVWWPIADVIRQALHIDATDTADEAAAKTLEMVAVGMQLPGDHPDTVRATDGLLHLLRLPSTLQDVDPARAREEGVRAFLGLLRVLVAKQPVVLQLSELHWADPLVLDLVDRIAERLRGTAFVLIATARTELEERWSPRPSGRNLVVLQLDPLDRASAAELVTALLDGAAAPDLVDAVLERAGGNPFFIEELTALVQEAAGRMPTAAMSSALPATLRSLVATRLDALAAVERRVLELAAVIGRAGSLDALSALHGKEGNVDRALDSLAAADLVTVSGGGWSFRSDLVREVAYETLTKTERARHHAGLGRFLADEARQRDREGEQLEAIAHHLGLAAELSRDVGSIDGTSPELVDAAVDAIGRASDQAERRETPAVVVRLADRALALLPADRRASRRRFLVRRARANTVLRNLDQARADVAVLLPDAEAENDEWVVASALTIRGHIEQTDGALYESVANLDEAIARWQRLGDRSGEAEALRLRGMTDMFLGRLLAAEETISRAHALFEELDDRRGQAWAQWTTAWIAFTAGDHDQADSRISTALKLFEEIGDYGGLSWANGLLAWVRLQQGFLDEADRLAELSLHEVEEESDRWAFAMMLMLRASTRLWRGHTEEAVRLATEARDAFRAINDSTGELRSIATLSRALLHAGRPEQGAELLRTGRRMAERELDPELRTLGSVIVHGFGVQVGDVTRAAELVGTRVIDADRDGGSSGDDDIYAGLALLQLGRVDDAVRWLEAAVEHAQSPGTRANAGAASALALATAGRAADAVGRADAVLGAGDGTYLDRSMALVARAFALRLGDAGAGIAAADEAVMAADGTGDRLLQALTRLARARLLEARWHAQAGPALQDATARLTAMGIEHTAWDDVYQRAARAG